MAFTMVLVFGVYAFVSGVATVIASARSGRAGDSWGTLLLEGLLGIGAGVVALLWPAATALAFVWVIGIWAIAIGALEIASAIKLRKLIAHEWAMGIAGAISIAFGLLAFYRPLSGGLAIVWWLGAYALLFGVMSIVVGFRLRRLAHPREELPAGGLHQRA
jgi:uncharacterized membrane protein HdeD (DUF308 family)